MAAPAYPMPDKHVYPAQPRLSRPELMAFAAALGIVPIVQPSGMVPDPDSKE